MKTCEPLGSVIECSVCGRECQKRKKTRKCIPCERVEARRQRERKPESRRHREDREREEAGPWAHELSKLMLRKPLLRRQA